GDGYIILKGGTGTLVEFAMVWELMNKSIISGKPIIAVTEFWKPVIDLLGHELSSEGMASSAQYVKIARDAREAAEMMIYSLLQK
ncbi:MAG TPA: LOG family protein, partial [Candidatus Kryptobacter bacterium]|nr:LOG family protein [Candidatus Kryptobacter bacterium]